MFSLSFNLPAALFRLPIDFFIDGFSAFGAKVKKRGDIFISINL